MSRPHASRDPPAVPVPPHLLRAYCATAYTVETATVRIGRRSEAMDAMLSQLGSKQGVFVTAWNPRSRRMPTGWNHRMQRRLSERLRRWPILPASGSWRQWQEEHLLAAADPRPIRHLARLFRQRAVVLVARRQPARLALLAPWPRTRPGASTDRDPIVSGCASGTQRPYQRRDIRPTP